MIYPSDVRVLDIFDTIRSGGFRIVNWWCVSRDVIIITANGFIFTILSNGRVRVNRTFSRNAGYKGTLSGALKWARGQSAKG